MSLFSLLLPVCCFTWLRTLYTSPVGCLCLEANKSESRDSRPENDHDLRNGRSWNWLQSAAGNNEFYNEQRWGTNSTQKVVPREFEEEICVAFLRSIAFFIENFCTYCLFHGFSSTEYKCEMNVQRKPWSQIRFKKILWLNTKFKKNHRKLKTQKNNKFW